MPLYFYELRDGTDGIKDLEGTELPNDRAARQEAEKIAQQLMLHVELKTRHWLIDVRDAGGRLVLALPFATIDHTLAHLRPEARRRVERVSETWRRLLEEGFRSRMLILKARAIRAQSRGKPYLTASRGQRI